MMCGLLKHSCGMLWEGCLGKSSCARTAFRVWQVSQNVWVAFSCAWIILGFVAQRKVLAKCIPQNGVSVQMFLPCCTKYIADSVCDTYQVDGRTFAGLPAQHVTALIN